jgi:hypothetical protein
MEMNVLCGKSMESEVGLKLTPSKVGGEAVQIIDPSNFVSWDSILASQPGHSFFHTSHWARVLKESYGHRPLYFVRVAEGRISALLSIMEVSSPLTGVRGVSLPFTDFCLPLTAIRDGLSGLFEAAIKLGNQNRWKFLECRGNTNEWPSASCSIQFRGHFIQLDSKPESVFERFEPAIRRGIRKADAAGIKVEFGNDLNAMRCFYALHCQTRRRHGVPPQPFKFFENLVRYAIQRDCGYIVIASVNKIPIAAAVFLHSNKDAMYKYGASDYGFQNLRPNNLVMWAAIQRYCRDGFERVHLGRTSFGNEGLRRFKLGFGAEEEVISYSKYDFRKSRFVSDVDRAEGAVNRVFRRMPSPIFHLMGRMLYPHLS